MYFSRFHRTDAGKPEDIFTHCYMIISWNLMCRSSNTATICLSHLEWVNDSLACYFASQKNDQGGEHTKDPRHIYSNTARPSICPVLSLAIFFLVFPFENGQLKLFNGTNQSQRFPFQILFLLLITLILFSSGIQKLCQESFQRGIQWCVS